MVNVVAGIIRNEEGKILITQRNLKKAQGGLWEFPGGKIEPNETKEDAIAFWNTGMWELCVDRESISVLPVKIKVEIDVACLGLDWNGM
jgi:8-oxo-dGTP pyrophosphatase MutT (NUDIX family)